MLALFGETLTIFSIPVFGGARCSDGAKQWRTSRGCRRDGPTARSSDRGAGDNPPSL